MVEQTHKHRLASWLEWVLTILAGIALALVVRVFVAEVYLVPSGSMLETIHEGDRLIGEKITPRFSGVQAHEIVTFADPDGSGMTLIKRVIAVGGQSVDLRDGVVYVDGVAQDESYTEGKPSYPLNSHATNLSNNLSYPIEIPNGYVWVMGDNRTNSLDSRYFGPVSVDAITSKAVVIFWPPSDAQQL